MFRVLEIVALIFLAPIALIASITVIGYFFAWLSAAGTPPDSAPRTGESRNPTNDRS